MITITPSELLRFARIAAMRLCRQFDREDLTDDAAAHAVLLVIERPEWGHGPKQLHHGALDYLRRWFGEIHGHRLRPGTVELSDTIEAKPGLDAPSRAIALWRLQEVYPTLTAKQQAALFEWCQGQERRRGVTPSLADRRRSAQRAGRVKSALERLMDPGRYSRVASRAAWSAEERRANRNMRSRRRKARTRAEQPPRVMSVCADCEQLVHHPNARRCPDCRAIHRAELSRRCSREYQRRRRAAAAGSRP